MTKDELARSEVVVRDRGVIDRLSAGRYVIGGTVRREDYFDICADVTFKDADVVTVVHVTANAKELPQGVDEAYFRPDGTRVVIATEMVH